jgi:hypothetical protein
LVDTNYIEAELNGATLNGIWKDCLDSYDYISNSDKIECLGQVIELRDHIIEVLRDISDGIERQSCLALFYLGLKTEWMLLNTQYTYQLEAQKLDHQTVCRAGLFSALLGALEPHCRPADIVRIEELLAQLPNNDDASIGNDAQSAQNAQSALRGRVQELSEALACRDTTLQRLQDEWQLLEVGLGKHSAREIVECVRELKDDLLQLQRTGGSVLPEKYLEFDREFGGLSARQVASQLERMDFKVRSLEKESQATTEGQELLLRELGDADPRRLIARFGELQDTVTNLSMELARLKAGSTPNIALAPAPEEDLNSLLGSLESALHALNH